MAKCVVWFPVDHCISLPPNFLTFDSGFHILGALVGSTSFFDSFMPKIGVEQTEGNERSYFYLYPFRKLIKETFMCALSKETSWEPS